MLLESGSLVSLSGFNSMNVHPLITAALCNVALFHPLASCAQVPSGGSPMVSQRVPVFTQDQLLDLVGRVALYPDDLLGLLLASSTTPLEIVKAQRFLDAYAKNKALKPDSSLSEPVRNLLTYPDIIGLMADDLDWTEAMGQAVAAQQQDVLQAIQVFRRKAQTAGNLKTDDKQKVILQQDIIQIIPALPEVVYLPRYEPSAVIVEQSAPALSYAPTAYPVYYSSGAVGVAAYTGFLAGTFMAYGVNWGGGSLYYGAGVAHGAYMQDLRRDDVQNGREDWQDYGKGRREDWQDYSKNSQSQRQQAVAGNQSARQQVSTSKQAARQSAAPQISSAQVSSKVFSALPAGAQKWQAAGQLREPSEKGVSKAGGAPPLQSTGNTSRGSVARPVSSTQGGPRATGGASASVFSGAASGAQSQRNRERGAQSMSSMSRGKEAPARGGGAMGAPSRGSRSGGGGRGGRGR